MEERGSPIVLILCIIIMAAVCGGLVYLRKIQPNEAVQSAQKEGESALPEVQEKVEEVEQITSNLTDPVVYEKAEKIQDVAVKFESLDELTQNFEYGLMRLKSAEDLGLLLQKLGASDVSEQQLKKLFVKIGPGGTKLQLGNIMDEIGELKRNQEVRWALNLANGDRVFFDLKKRPDGSWEIKNFNQSWLDDSGLDAILESGNAARLDGLMVAHSFVQFAIQQEFPKAKKLVDPLEVLDVQLAGLCILFEEGKYQLRKQRGVLRAFENAIKSGYTVYIRSPSNGVADFSLLLGRKSVEQPWRITELNFSRLLNDFLKKNGGDSYYSPFVKNPQGGDSIVVYFEFDEDGLSQRTQRQLQIVADVLKLDTNKKIVLTGHTDDLGADNYNRKLSKKRAEAVRDFLVGQGVVSNQITTIGYGKYRPRSSNKREDGTDNPEGRKANRRTEIYLDF